MNTTKQQMLITGIKFGIPVLGGVGLFLVGRSIIRNRSKGNQDGTKHSEAPSIAKMKIDYEKLTISPDDAALMAQSLYQAMAVFGSKEKVIYSVFKKIKTKDDLLLLISKFGLRKNFMGSRALMIGQNINLIAWLNIDLEEKELNVIRPVFDAFGIPL